MSERGSTRGIHLEEKEILNALEAADGHQRHAAEMLKVSPAWLAKWLSRNGYKQIARWVKEPEQEAEPA